MTAPHPYEQDELAAGRAQAGQFLERIAAGPIEVDALAQQVELARMGSMPRLRGFAARIQEALREVGHATTD